MIPQRRQRLILSTLFCLRGWSVAFLQTTTTTPSNSHYYHLDENSNLHSPPQTTNLFFYGNSGNVNGGAEEFEEDWEGRRRRRRRRRRIADSSFSAPPSRFATGEELKTLRQELKLLRATLRWAAETMNDPNTHNQVSDLAREIRIRESRDPEIAYTKALDQMTDIMVDRERRSTIAEAQKDDNNDDGNDQENLLLESLSKEAELARSYLPRFQLEGLWVGNYGSDGPQLVNVTYVGNKLLATKVTGDTHVSRGQVSFTADLAPRSLSSSNNNNATGGLKLSIFSFSDSNIQKRQGRWQRFFFFLRRKHNQPPTQQLQDGNAISLDRYPGQGQTRIRTFGSPLSYHSNNVEFVDGELVLLEENDCFLFLWILNSSPSSPVLFQVLFRRPTALQTLNLLRDVLSKEDELDNQRRYVSRCFALDDDIPSHKRDFVMAAKARRNFRRIPSQRDLQILRQEQEHEEEGGLVIDATTNNNQGLARRVVTAIPKRIGNWIQKKRQGRRP